MQLRLRDLASSEWPHHAAASHGGRQRMAMRRAPGGRPAAHASAHAPRAAGAAHVLVAAAPGLLRGRPPGKKASFNDFLDVFMLFFMI